MADRILIGNVKGEKGDKGDQGIQGVKGDKGDKGDKGLDYGDHDALYLNATMPESLMIPNSTFTTLTNLTVDSNGVNFDPVTGNFTPTKPGLWLVIARVHYANAEGGAMYLRINVGGSVRAEELKRNDTTYQTGVDAQTIIEFTGSNSFHIATQQSSGAELRLNANRNTRIQAIYLGGL